MNSLMDVSFGKVKKKRKANNRNTAAKRYLNILSSIYLDTVKEGKSREK